MAAAILGAGWLLGIAPMTAHAEEAPAAGVRVGTASYATIEEALPYWTEGTTMTLLSPLQTSTITVNASKTLDLNGFTLTGDGKGSVLSILGGEFTLTSSQSGGAVTGGNATYGGGIYVSGATLDFTGGSVRGNSSSWEGGGVYLTQGARLNLRGGSVEDNVAHYGGGVFVHESTVEMSGGSIERNRASFNGGGVYLFGTSSAAAFTLTSGEIKANHASLYGGGVSLWTKSSFAMRGGSVSENEASSGGAGICVRSEADEPSELSITDGSVTGNRTGRIGGGLLIDIGGKAEISGGSVSANTAKDGAGVYLSSGSSTVFSGKVSVIGNKSGSQENNLRVSSANLFTVAEGFSGEIGICMEGGGVLVEDYAGPTAGLKADDSYYAIRVVGGDLRLASVVPVVLTVSKQPSKTEYKPGESFDPSGMVVEVVYADGLSAVVDGYTVEGGEGLKAGASKVEIVYTENGTTFRVPVTISVSGKAGSDPADGSSVGFFVVIALAALFVISFIVVAIATHGFKGKPPKKKDDRDDETENKEGETGQDEVKDEKDEKEDKKE